MKCIEDKILKDGYVINNDILKVDSFLNHQVDPKTIDAFAKEVKKEFEDQKIDVAVFGIGFVSIYGCGKIRISSFEHVKWKVREAII